MEGTKGARSPGATVQDVLREDAIAPLEVLLREYSPCYSNNQESRIRHFHETLDQYLESSR